jgi:6,7-dimethyl-8-ribityllumazine synthase
VAAEAIDIAWVPGAFEIPLVARRLAQLRAVDGIICLKAVIRGETAHFDLVANESARGIADVARDTGVPVIFEVLAVDDLSQAEARTGGAHGNYVVEAFNFAIDGDEVRAIGMDDLFLDAKVGRSAVSERCVAALRAQDAMWVTGGTVTDVTDLLDTFHFENGQIVVHFAPYEVGPFAEGEHVVEVPFEALRGVRPAWKNRLAELPSSRDSIEFP